MQLQLQDVDAEDLYRAVQRGMNGAVHFGEGLIVDVKDSPTEGLLATLARLRYIEQGIQLGAAEMLNVPVSVIAAVTTQIATTLLLDRVIQQGLSVDNATALSGGFGDEQLVKAGQRMAEKVDLKAALEALEAVREKREPA